jgi:hypothetical protein
VLTVYLLDYESAIDRMRERVRESEDARRLALARPRDHEAVTVRRRLALGLASVSRASAAGVRRLDACLADDLVAHVAANR